MDELKAMISSLQTTMQEGMNKMQKGMNNMQKDIVNLKKGQEALEKLMISKYDELTQEIRAVNARLAVFQEEMTRIKRK